MPTKPKRPCNHPGCSQLTRKRYCETHLKAVVVPTAWRTTEGSSTSRGYGAAWRKLRKMILARDPFCVLCERAPSQHVDHIIPKALGGTDEMKNLRGVCPPCHSRKTATDSHARRGESDGYAG